MKIDIIRSGGIIGAARTLGSADSAALAPDAVRRLTELVEKVGFFELPAQVPAEVRGADQFRYRITLTDGGRTHTVMFVDDGRADTEALRELVQQVAGTL